MFTVMHHSSDGNRLYEAIAVTQYPEPRVFDEGTPAERTQPASVFLQYRAHDTSGHHIYDGEVYVMNGEGKTVARFPIDVPPPAV